MESKLRVGIIGTGVGLRTHYPGFKRTNSVEFVGLVGSSYERAKEFATKYEFKNVFKSYKELINSDQVDLVCVTSPNPLHLEEILLAMEKDKHILAEKPLAMNMDEIQMILQREKKHKEKLHLIDHELRFNPYLRKVKSILTEGQLGRPYFIRIHQQSTGYSDRNANWVWSFDETQGGGVRLAMASHLVDLINFWFDGIKPLTVKGSMDTVVRKRKDPMGMARDIKVSDFFSADISFENELNVQLSATAAAIGIPRFDFSIYGTDGELHFDLQNKLSGSFLTNRGKVESLDVQGVTDEERANRASIFSGSFVYFARSIVDFLLLSNAHALDPAAKFKDALYTQALLDAIKVSSLEGTIIKLNEGYRCDSLI